MTRRTRTSRQELCSTHRTKNRTVASNPRTATTFVASNASQPPRRADAMHNGCQHLKSRRTKVAGNSSGLPQLPATNHHHQLARSSTPNPRTQPPSPPHIRPRPKSTSARTHASTVAKTSHCTRSVPGPLPSVSVCLCLSLSLSPFPSLSLPVSSSPMHSPVRTLPPPALAHNWACQRWLHLPWLRPPRTTTPPRPPCRRPHRRSPAFCQTTSFLAAWHLRPSARSRRKSWPRHAPICLRRCSDSFEPASTNTTGRSKHSSRGRERSADQSWQHEPAELSSAPWERGNQRMLSCTAAAGACLRARTHVHACARMLWRICVQFDCRKFTIVAVG